MAFSSTIQALENITDFSNFERLCCDLLSCFKYEGIVPRGVGKIDGGIDAVFVNRAEDTVSFILKKTVFHFSTRKDYEAKLYEDLKKTAKHDPTEVVFVTNRRIEPLTQDRIIKDVKVAYNWELTIYDQEWLRIPLDNDYQDLRRKYLSIPEQLTIFENLDNILKNKYRHPNAADFEYGKYYRNELFHSAFDANIKNHRICLIKGKPGSGKTALARGVGYDFIRESPKNIVLYLTADSRSSCKDWLSQIQQGDHTHVLYIIDNCHNAINDVNELIDRRHRINNAKICLITRSIASETAGTTDMNYLTILEDNKCVLNNDVTADTIRQIIKRQCPSDGNKEIDDVEKIYEKCQGDLHLLNFYMNVWRKESNLKPLSEIEEDEILDDVYSRYFLNSPTRDYLQAACPLWQYEIPVQIGWRCGSEDRDLIQQDAFIEGFVSVDYADPLYFFKYFHSTPAYYLLKALYKKGLLGKSIFEYTKEQVMDYLSINPANFFNVFYQLYKNGEEALEWELFNDGIVLEKCREIIFQKDVPFLMNKQELPVLLAQG